MRSLLEKKILRILALAAAFTAAFTFFAFAAEANYEHDPRRCWNTMKDVEYDPAAIYRYRPAADSARLGSYAAFDWTDAALVEKSRQERIAYFQDSQKLTDLMVSMQNEGRSVEEVARAVSALRNQIRLDSYKNNPEGLAAVKESNLKKYGNENGPTADSLYAQKGSWEAVLAGAFSSNPGMDAVLGLYDDSYEFNTKVGAVSEEDPVIYAVRKNDTLCSIAKKYFGSDDCNALFRANRNVIADPDVIMEGQKLVIPLG